MKPRRLEIFAFTAMLLAAAALFVSLQGSVRAAPGSQDAGPTIIPQAPVAAPAVVAAPVATVPQTFNYQGVLRDGQGNLVTNPTQALTVRIWDVPTGGTTAKHTETFPSVPVRDGLFNIVIGDDPANPLKDGDLNISPRYIGVTLAAGTELIPRQRIHPVPMAFLAETANSATTAITATTLVAGASVNNVLLNGTSWIGDTYMNTQNINGSGGNSLVFDGSTNGGFTVATNHQ